MNTPGVQKPIVTAQVCLTGPDGIESTKPVLLFSKLNKMFFGYFDPENIFLHNENN